MVGNKTGPGILRRRLADSGRQSFARTVQISPVPDVDTNSSAAVGVKSTDLSWAAGEGRGSSNPPPHADAA